MNTEDWEKIRELIHDAVKEAIEGERLLVETAIDKHARSSDHIAFKLFVKREERRQNRWDVIMNSVVGTVAIGLLYWVGSHVLGFIAYLAKHGLK